MYCHPLLKIRDSLNFTLLRELSTFTILAFLRKTLHGWSSKTFGDLLLLVKYDDVLNPGLRRCAWYSGLDYNHRFVNKRMVALVKLASLTGPEIWASATSKAWRDSSRAAYFLRIIMPRKQNETESPTVRRVPGFQIPAKKIDCRVIKYSFKIVKGGTFWQEKKNTQTNKGTKKLLQLLSDHTR